MSDGTGRRKFSLVGANSIAMMTPVIENLVIWLSCIQFCFHVTRIAYQSEQHYHYKNFPMDVKFPYRGSFNSALKTSIFYDKRLKAPVEARGRTARRSYCEIIYPLLLRMEQYCDSPDFIGMLFHTDHDP
jgi:hypothetical protein